MTELARGTLLGPYEITAQIGAGGMGEVFRARDTRLDRTVAIKILPAGSSDEILRRRLTQEARAISSLSHPNLCALYDVGRSGERDFIVMEYLEGETLAARLQRGAMTVGEALQCSMEIASALEAAHHKGIIHRDLKATNVMLTPSGARLLDFGLARLTNAAAVGSLTAEGVAVGTLEYMAPEVIGGRQGDERGDIFAFGVLLYEMLTGQRPFDRDSAGAVAGAILHADPEPLPDAPDLDRVVRACLEKNPDDRIQTAHDLKLHLEWLAAASGEPSRSRTKFRARVLQAAAALALVVGGLAAGWSFASRVPSTPATAPAAPRESRAGLCSSVAPGAMDLQAGRSTAVQFERCTGSMFDFDGTRFRVAASGTYLAVATLELAGANLPASFEATMRKNGAVVARKRVATAENRSIALTDTLHLSAGDRVGLEVLVQGAGSYPLASEPMRNSFALTMVGEPLRPAMTLELHVDLHGGDYRSIPRSSAEACRAACLAEPFCKAYTFDGAPARSTYGYCYLKHAVPRARWKADDVSGVKIEPR